MTQDELLDAFPGVRVDQDNAAYYGGLLEDRVLVNRCDDCASWHHPPRSACARCWSRSLTPTAVAGTGTIVLLTVLHQGSRKEGADFSAGHPLVAVELDEQPGLRLGGTVLGADPATLQLGERVRVVVRRLEGRGPRVDFERMS